MRILYIEDNPANISLLQRIARMGGHDVLYYNDGEVALSNFERDKPDLILVDLQLAGILDGLDVVRKLRSDGVKLPIVAVTAYAMVGDKERCLEAGCDGYLAKPLPVAELVEIVQKYQLTAKATDVKPAETPKETVPLVAAESEKQGKVEDITVSDRSHLLRETAPLVDPTRTVMADHKVVEKKEEPAASVKPAEAPPSPAPAKPEAAPKPTETPAKQAETAPVGSVPPAPTPAPKVGTAPLGSVPPTSTPTPKADPVPVRSVPPAPTPAPKADTPAVESASSTPTPKVDSSAEKAQPPAKPTDDSAKETPVSPNGSDTTIRFAVAPQKAENGKKE